MSPSRRWPERLSDIIQEQLSVSDTAQRDFFGEMCDGSLSDENSGTFYPHLPALNTIPPRYAVRGGIRKSARAQESRLACHLRFTCHLAFDGYRRIRHEHKWR
ncbi:hypothetical protein [Dickeya fangzhongdai]|uniref:hypothetical protein n=1 Tax=Dickeya fangzhongdai TaxID=1778540 RepID=UPI0026DFAF8F|nr:hypothetical protein [Dickeya fangzhongdai]WKV53076.1 hypothetical protein PL145_00125 [Dickeya fangzhongdai]